MIRKPTKPEDTTKSKVLAKKLPSKSFIKINQSKNTLKTELKTKPGASDSAIEFDDERTCRPEELIANDENRLSDDKFKKSGDHLSKTSSTASMQEHMENTRQLMADLEVERAERKRLECYSQRLKSQMQTLQLRVDRRTSESICSPSMSSSSLPQDINKSHNQTEKVTIGQTQFPEPVVARTLVDKYSETEKTLESLRAELELKKSKIAELENGSRLLEARCAALESETGDLRSTVNLTAIRSDKLEKENVDLKSELDNEMRLHSEEIAKLSKQTQTATNKAEALDKENADLRYKLAEIEKTQCEEIERWANTTRVAIAERNEATKTRSGQHDIVTQQLIDLQRKDNFIMTIKCENEELCRKNKVLERRIEVYEEESKMLSLHRNMSNDERAEFQKRFEQLRMNFEETKDAYQNLLAIREEEMKQSKRATREKEEEHNRMKVLIGRITNEIDSLRIENENLIKKLDEYRYNIYEDDVRSINIGSVYREDSDETCISVCDLNQM